MSLMGKEEETQKGSMECRCLGGREERRILLLFRFLVDRYVVVVVVVW